MSRERKYRKLNLLLLGEGGEVSSLKITPKQLKWFLLVFFMLIIFSILTGVGYMLLHHRNSSMKFELRNAHNALLSTQKLMKEIKVDKTVAASQEKEPRADKGKWTETLRRENIERLNIENKMLEVADLSVRKMEELGELNVSFKLKNKMTESVLRGYFVFLGILPDMIVTYPNVISFPAEDQIIDPMKGESFTIKYFKSVDFKVAWTGGKGLDKKAFLMFYDRRGNLLNINKIKTD